VIIMTNWLTGWGFRKSHIISAAAGAGTNYQVCIKVYYGNGVDGTEVLGDMTIGKVYLGGNGEDTSFGDVRFTDNDGDTELDYWMEEHTDSDYALFWVEVKDDLTTDPVTIYIYYGKADTNTTSNGPNTFSDLFDHFDTLDLTKWTVSGSVAVASSIVTCTRTAGTDAYIKSKSTFQYKALRALWKYAVYTNYQRLGFNSAAHGSPPCMTFVTYSAKLMTWCYVTGSEFGDFGAVGAGSFVKADLKRKNGEARFVHNDTTLNAETNQISTSSLSIILEADDDGTSGPIAYADWILIRSYVSPEPAHSTWGDEEGEEAPVGVKSSGSIVVIAEALLFD